MTVEEAVEFLRLRSIELDPNRVGSQSGISFVVRSPKTISNDEELENSGLDGFGDELDPNASYLTFEAYDIGCSDALDLLCKKAALKWKFREIGIEISVDRDSVRRELERKLTEVVIPRFHFNNTTVEEALEFFKA